MDKSSNTECCASAISTDLNHSEETTTTTTSGHDVILEADSALNTQKIIQQRSDNHDDSDDDESKKPTISVVIDEEEAHVSTENDHSEITSTTVEEIPACLIEDHDYVGPRSVNRNPSGYFGDNNEPFPVLEGLESYIGDDDHSEYVNSNSRLAFNQNRRFRDQHGRVTSSVPTVINANYGSGAFSRVQQMRAVFRGDGYSPVAMSGVRMQNRRIVGSQQLPTVFNQRQGARRLEPIAGGARYATPVTANNRSGVISSSNYQNAALIANDPSRAANEVAPAPLIIPARGAKTVQRNRVSTPNRGLNPSSPVVGGANYSPSPRKVYQLTRGNVEYVSSNDMPSYVKVPDNCEPTSDEYGLFGKVQQQQYNENNRRTNEATDSASAAIIDVVEEEEAQNAKFFQRQPQGIGILPLRDKQTRRISYNEITAHDNQQGSPMKPSNDELAVPISQSLNNQQRSPMSGLFRTVHGNVGPHSIPSILQRGQQRSTPGQLPVECSSGMEQQQDVNVSVPLNPEMVIASKQAQRPRGRPRNQRLPVDSGGGGHQNVPNAVLNRQLQQQQRFAQPPNMYNEHQQPQQIYADHQQISESEISTSVSSKFLSSSVHPLVQSSVNSASAIIQDYHHQPQTNEVSGQQPSHLSYVYQQSQQQHHIEQNIPLPDFHSQQHLQHGQQANVNNANTNAAIIQHPQQYLQTQHIDKQQQCQRLQDLADLAQLSQHQQFPSTQRQIYQHPDGTQTVYLSYSGKNPTKQGYIEVNQRLDQQVTDQQQQQYFAPEDQNLQQQQQLSNYPTYSVYTENEQGMYGRNNQLNTPQLDSHLTGKLRNQRVTKRTKVLEEMKDNDVKSVRKLPRCLKKGTESEQEDWEGEDYTTRCLCDMSHNDEFMIECERCNVWQHGVCMGISPKNVPEMYFCELCQPRPLKHTKQQAAALQQRKLSKVEDVSKKSKDKKKQKFNHKAKKGKPAFASNSKTTVPPNKKSTAVFRNFIEITENQYSRSLRSFIQQTQNLGNPDFYNALKGEVLARQMFVASNVKGLVATHEIMCGLPVIEYSGCFSLASESSIDKLPTKNNFILRYTGFGDGSTVVIDASKMGSAARFARRSCKPNTRIAHVIQDGRLHVFLVATENIDFSAEVTIPFDYDYNTSQVPISCACGNYQFSVDDCEISKFNLALDMAKDAIGSDQGLPSIKKRVKLSSSSSTDSKNVTTPRSSRKSLPVKPLTDDSVNLKEKDKREVDENLYSSSPESKRTKSSRISFSSEDDSKSNIKVDSPLKPISEHVLVQKEATTDVKPRRSARNVSPKLEVDAEVKIDESLDSLKEKNKLSTKVLSKSSEDVSTSSTSRKTRSFTAKENDSKTTPTSRGKLTPKPVKNAVPTDSTNQIKLTREERKLQEALAAIERLELREKQKQERRSYDQRLSSSTKKQSFFVLSAPSSSVKSKTPEKKRSARLASSSSFSSITSSTSVQKKSLENSLSPIGKRSKRNSNAAMLSEKEASSPKKNRMENKQLSHVEAAQLLTEMASGMKSELPDDSSTTDLANEDLRAQIVRIAELALEQNKVMSKKNAKSTIITKDFDLSKDHLLLCASPILKSGKQLRSPEQKNLMEPETSNNIDEVAAETIALSNAKAVKKLTLDEYRRRKSSAAGSVDTKQLKLSPQKPQKTASFMPSFTNVCSTASLDLPEPRFSPKSSIFDILISSSPPSPNVPVLPATVTTTSQDTVSIDELKRRIYGGKIGTKVTEGEKSQTDVATTSKPSIQTNATNSAQQPRPSLEERLQKQFGLGKSSVDRNIPSSSMLDKLIKSPLSYYVFK